MDKYLKMADVFGDVVTQKLVGDAYEIMSHSYGHVCVVNTEERADMVAHAINSHDELVEVMNHYKSESRKWAARAVKDSSRANDLKDKVDELTRHLKMCATELSGMIDRHNVHNQDDDSWLYDHQVPWDAMQLIK